MSRDTWLKEALRVLAERGSAGTHIDALTRELGVTKGSFYHHFKNRVDFSKSLIDYWLNAYTMNVVATIDAFEGSAEERLYALMRYIDDTDASKYDVAIRAWASKDPVLDEMVSMVDQVRINYVRNIFSDIGFQGKELDIRTRTFVAYHSLSAYFFGKLNQTADEADEFRKSLHNFFIRK
jgi:AcrR family transcriptional regulator